MQVPINLTGGTYRHKSLPLSAQVTRNLWPQKQLNPTEKSDYILETWVGKKLFGSIASSGSDRGMLFHKNVLYKVTNDTLYSVSSTGVHSALGIIGNTTRCIMLGVSEGVLIVTSGVVYLWDIVALTLTTGVDVDLGFPNAATYLNGIVIYDYNAVDSEDGDFCNSDVGNSLSIDGLNYGRAESNADDLVRPYAFNQLVYMLGSETIEPHQNTGQGNPPFDRIEGGIKEIGLGALHAVGKNKDYLYILSNENEAVAIQGATSSKVISTPAWTQEISSYSTVSDAIIWCMKLKEQEFVVYTFPTANKTWVYPEDGEWFEWSSGIEGGRDISNSYAFAYRKHLVADYENGNIYELDFETYTDNGEVIIRQRDCAPLHGGLFSKPDKLLRMNSLTLIMETGVGLIIGQGSDPAIMLSWSDDGGKTFSTPMVARVGKLGEFDYGVRFDCLGSFKSRILRIATSDPVYYSIHSASADLEIGI